MSDIEYDLSGNSNFYIRNNKCKPEKKQFFKKFTCKFSIDCCDQTSSENHL